MPQNAAVPACIASCKAEQRFAELSLFAERGTPERADGDKLSDPENITCVANLFDFPADPIRPGDLEALLADGADSGKRFWKQLSSADCKLVLDNPFDVAAPIADDLKAPVPDVRVTVRGEPVGSVYR